MRQQSQEEIIRAMKSCKFDHACDGREVLRVIPQSPYESSSPLAAFSRALAHERKGTARINAVYALTVRQQDNAAQVLSQ
jgi:ferritin